MTMSIRKLTSLPPVDGSPYLLIKEKDRFFYFIACFSGLLAGNSTGKLISMNGPISGVGGETQRGFSWWIYRYGGYLGEKSIWAVSDVVW